MPHRDITVGLIGIVTGVLLGAGTAAVSGATSLAANAQPIPTTPGSFHSAPDAANYTRRKIDARGIRLYRDSEAPSKYPTLKSQSSSSSSTASVASDAITTCTAVRRSVDKIMQVYNAMVPDTIKNTEIRQAMDAAFADVADDYCETAQTGSVSSAKASGSSKVDNDCEKYPKRTIRYSQCVIAEEHGVKYPE